MLLAWVPTEALACRLALVLAIDVSKSVDSEEYLLQFRGLADAFRDVEVRAAILNHREPVAAMAFEWSGEGHQAVVVDWMLFSRAPHVERFAYELENHLRTGHSQRTGLGSALQFASNLLAEGPNCSRQVIDVSGDGYNNVGAQPSAIYRTLVLSEATVNALVIGGLERPALKQYFESEVISGPGAFAIATQGFEDYADAILEKLLRELTPDDVVAKANGN